MPVPNLFLIFTKPLHKIDIPYAVTGSVAAIIYGEPRMTHDIDLIITIRSGEITKFISAFPAQKFYIPPEDIIRIESKREERGHINLIHHDTGFKADIYFAGRDELCTWALKNAITVTYHSVQLNIAPPEYVILRKLEYYREGQIQKHLLDIQKILKHSEEKINFQWLNVKIEQLALNSEWQAVQSMPDTNF